MKTALITGITGQAGHYLTKILLGKGYRVVGLKRRTSTNSEHRLKEFRGRINLEYGDITDISTLIPLLQKYRPQHFYNLGAQSHVWVSFKEPLHTFDVTAKGVLNCLEAIRLSGLDCKFFQASSSEMFGSNVSYYADFDMTLYHNDYNNLEPWEKKYHFFQNEETPFNPQSPYAVAKTAAHHYCQLYKRAYGMWISCGIMGNYESPHRGEEFVTRKITKYLAQLISSSSMTKLKLGNIESFRDWSYAEDTMEAVSLMMEQNIPDNYVIGTGESRTIREFIDTCMEVLGDMKFNINKDFYEIDPELYRPSEVPYLRMDSSKIRRLGWKPKCTFKELVKKMILGDIG